MQGAGVNNASTREHSPAAAIFKMQWLLQIERVQQKPRDEQIDN
jgi:hypothetical protein